MTFFSYLSIAVRYGRGMFKACNGLELFVTAPFFFRWCWGDMGLLESIFLLEHVNISNFLLDNGIVHCLSNKMMHSYCDTISFLITLFLISASNYNLILMGKTFPQPPSILRRISAYGDFWKKKKILISLTPALPIVIELLSPLRSSDPLHWAPSSFFFVSITITSEPLFLSVTFIYLYVCIECCMLSSDWLI